MADYFLPHHVYYCCRADALVFLDLRRDEYTMVNGGRAAALRGLSSTEPADRFRPEFLDALEELLDGGLLTTDRGAGRDPAPTRMAMAMDLLIDPEATLETHVTFGHLWSFSLACAIAAMRLRWNRLEDTVDTVEQRKKRHVPSSPTNMTKARELTAVFHKLRSFLPVKYICLYDSLALLEFLARYQIFPNWVFGVRLEPWAAHCWVQDSGSIFNEGIEEAANYTPVMVI